MEGVDCHHVKVECAMRSAAVIMTRQYGGQSFRLTNFKVMTRDVGFDTKASFSNNTCSRYI